MNEAKVQSILAMSPADLTRIPQGNLISQCSEAGFSEDQIAKLLEIRNHHISMEKELGEIDEIVTSTLDNPVVRSATRLAKAELELNALRKAQVKVAVVGVSIGLAFGFLLFG